MLKTKKVFNIKISVRDKNHLLNIIRERLADKQYYLQDLDVSKVEDFSYLFCDPIPDGDDTIGYGFEKQNWNIEGWDFSSAKNTEHMFLYSQIDCNLENCIGSFNTSQFKDIFRCSKFSKEHLPAGTDKNLTGWKILRNKLLQRS